MRNRIAIAAAMLAGLAGCGGDSGDNGGGGSSVPPFTPAPGPTPAPVTSDARSTTIVQPVTGIEILASGISVIANRQTVQQRLVPNGANFVSFAYNSLSRTYALQNEERSWSFGENDKRGDYDVPYFFPGVEYQRSASGELDLLVLYKECNCTPRIPVTAGASGTWQHNRPSGSDTNIRVDYFAYGVPAPQSAVPKSGSATYRWLGTGNYVRDTELWFVQTSDPIRVDFSSGQVTLGFSFSGEERLRNESSGGLPGFSMTAQISGNRFEGTLPAPWNGRVRGQFYGANAQDIGVVFEGVGPGATAAGSGVGTTP